MTTEVLRIYLKQSASLQRYTGTTNRAGDFEYEPNEESIKCRKRRTINANISGNEELAGASHIYTTDTIIQKNDKLDGDIVLGIDDIVNYAGVIIGTVAYT